MVDKINIVIECIVMILKMNKYVLKFFLFNDLCMGFQRNVYSLKCEMLWFGQREKFMYYVYVYIFII